MRKMREQLLALQQMEEHYTASVKLTIRATNNLFNNHLDTEIIAGLEKSIDDLQEKIFEIKKQIITLQEEIIEASLGYIK